MAGIKLSDKVQYRKEGEKGLLFIVSEDGDVKSVFLNETGRAIIELCDGNSSNDNIAEEVSKEFDISLEDVTSDVNEFIANLEKEGWLCNA